MTVVKKCQCVHEAQDQFHGNGMRVMNSYGGSKGAVGFRCTACGREHSPGGTVKTAPLNAAK